MECVARVAVDSGDVLLISPEGSGELEFAGQRHLDPTAADSAGDLLGDDEPIHDAIGALGDQGRPLKPLRTPVFKKLPGLLEQPGSQHDSSHRPHRRRRWSSKSANRMRWRYRSQLSETCPGQV